jgi:hypothetical protein
MKRAFDLDDYEHYILPTGLAYDAWHIGIDNSLCDIIISKLTS